MLRLQNTSLQVRDNKYQIHPEHSAAISNTSYAIDAELNYFQHGPYLYLSTLRWLPISDHSEFKQAVLVSAAVRCQMPSCTTE